jgi:acyl-CoA thioesterase-1
MHRLRFLLLALLLCLPAVAGARTILVFGDSLAAGYGLARGEGWVSLLEARLAKEKPGWQVVNASISGETTQGGAYRIATALKDHRPAVVVIELGANDGLRGLSLDATRANLETILKACRATRAKTVLVGMQLPPNYGMEYTRKFRALFPQLARQYRAALVPFLFEGIAADRSLFQADGLHPTAAAQPLLLNNVWPALAPLLH